MVRPEVLGVQGFAVGISTGFCEGFAKVLDLVCCAV